MALPTNRIRKIKLPDDNIYDIVPSTLTDGTTSYALTVPTLTSDSTIAIDANVVHKTGNETIGGNKTFTNKVDIYNGFEFRNADYTYAPTMITSSNNGLKMQFNTGSQYLQLSATPAGYINIQPNAGSVGVISNQYIKDNATLVTNTLNLPDSSGTLATTDDIPSVLGTGASNKNKYLHTNASTGALEWSSVTGPTNYLVSASASGTTLTILPNSGSAVNFYNYYPSRSYTAGLQISTSQGVTATCALYVPYANNSQAGVVSSDSQTFAGTKTFKTAASNSYGAVMPTTSSYTANKTIATTDLISSAEFVEVLPSTVTITFTESSSGLRTGLSIYDGSDDTGTLLYSIASGGSVTTPQTLTITSGNIFISTTGSRYTYISQGSTGGISNVVITNNGNSGVPVTLSAVVSDNGTLAISLDYDY